MIPLNVPKKSRVFPGEWLVAIVTPSFIRVTFLLRCMDLEWDQTADVLVLPLSFRIGTNFTSSSELCSHISGLGQGLRDEWKAEECLKMMDQENCRST